MFNNAKSHNLDWREFLLHSRENLGNELSNTIETELINAELFI